MVLSSFEKWKYVHYGRSIIIASTLYKLQFQFDFKTLDFVSFWKCSVQCMLQEEMPQFHSMRNSKHISVLYWIEQHRMTAIW